MTLGDRLKRAREKRGWDQQYVYAKTGISNTAISNYERNYREPDKDKLNKLADLYGVSTDWLLGRTDNPLMGGPAALGENEEILRQIVDKYDLDLSQPDARNKLEKIIELVLSDRPNKQ